MSIVKNTLYHFKYEFKVFWIPIEIHRATSFGIYMLPSIWYPRKWYSGYIGLVYVTIYIN